MSFASHRRFGNFHKTIVVQTNDPANKSVKLNCTGKIKRAFLGSPPTVRLGTIERDAGPQTGWTSLKRGNGGDIKPELVGPLPEGIQATIKELAPGQAYRIDVTVSPPWPNIPIRKFIRLKTGIDEAPYEMVRVDAAVVPRLRAMPKRFTLQLREDGGLEHRVKLEWDRTATNKTVRVTVNDSRLDVSLVEENGEQMVVLKAPAGYTLRRPRPMVTIETDDPVVPKLDIQVKQSRRRVATKKRTAPVGRATGGKPVIRRALPGEKPPPVGKVRLTPGRQAPVKAKQPTKP